MANDINNVIKGVQDFSAAQSSAAKSASELANEVANAGKSALDALNPFSGLKSIFSGLWDSKGIIGFAGIATALGNAENVLGRIEKTALGVTRAMGPYKDYAKWQSEIVLGAQQLGIEYEQYGQALEAANRYHASLSMSQKDFISFTKNASQFGEAVGASAQAGAAAFGKMVGEAKVGVGVIKNVQREMLALQNAVGLTGDELINLIDRGLTPVIKQMKLLGAADDDINRTVTAVGKLTASFVAAGFEAGAAADKVMKLLDPERLTENVMLFNQLGININDAIGAMTSGEGQDSIINQLNEQLPELAKRVKSMGFAGVQYAKSLGIDYRELLQYQNMSSKEAKEAAEKAAQERKEQETFNKQWQQTMSTWQKWAISLSQAFEQISMSIMEAFDAQNFRDIKELPLELGRMFAQFLKDIRIGDIVRTGIDLIRRLIGYAKDFYKALQPVINALFSKENLDRVSAIINRIVDAVGRVALAIMPLIPRVMTVIEKAITNILPKITSFIDKFASKIDEYIPMIEELIKSFLPFIDKIANFAGENPGTALSAMAGVAFGGDIMGFLESSGLGKAAMNIGGVAVSAATAQSVRVVNFDVIVAVFKETFSILFDIAKWLFPLYTAFKATGWLYGWFKKDNADSKDTAELYRTQLASQNADIKISLVETLKSFNEKDEKDKSIIALLKTQKDAMATAKTQDNLGVYMANMSKVYTQGGVDKLGSADLKNLITKGGIEGFASYEAANRRAGAELGQPSDKGQFNLLAIQNQDKWMEQTDKTNKKIAEFGIRMFQIKPEDALQYDKFARNFGDKSMIKPLSEMMKATDEKSKTMLREFKINQMIDRTFEPFKMFREKIKEQVAAGIITKEEAVAALTKQKNILENMSKNMTTKLNQSAMEITGKNKSIMSQILNSIIDGILDAVPDWAKPNFIIKGRQQEKDTTEVVSSSIEKALQNAEGVTSPEQLRQLIENTITQEKGILLTETGRQIADPKEMLDKYMKNNDYTIRNFLRNNKELNETMKEINNNTVRANEQRAGGNAALEEIAKNSKPKKPIRMINLNELAQRASESGATMLTFGSG